MMKDDRASKGRKKKVEEAEHIEVLMMIRAPESCGGCVNAVSVGVERSLALCVPRGARGKGLEGARVR